MKLNQLQETPVKAGLSAITNASTLSAQIDPASTATIVAGDLVKFTHSDGNTIVVDKAAATDQNPLGFVLYSVKKNSYKPGDAIEVALPGSVLWLESYGVIERGYPVEYRASGSRVTRCVGSNEMVGQALDNATATGQLIRVLVLIQALHSFSSSSVSSSSRSSSSSSKSSSSSSSSSKSSSSSSRKSSSSSSCSSSKSSSSSSCSSSSCSCSSSSSSV